MTETRPSVSTVLGCLLFLLEIQKVGSLSTDIPSTTTVHVRFPVRLPSTSSTRRIFSTTDTANARRQNQQDHDVRAAFGEIVDSTGFFTSNRNKNEMSCHVPALGETVRVSFERMQQTKDDHGNDHHDESSIKRSTRTPSSLTSSSPEASTLQSCSPVSSNQEYILTIQGQELTNEQFGWICVKFFECRELLECCQLDTGNLKDVVYHHFRPDNDPGNVARDAKLAGSARIDDIFQDESVLTTLQSRGFVVIDNHLPTTTLQQHRLLDKYLLEKSRQSMDIRTDMVHFLNRQEAKECDLRDHYDILMGMSSYLNEHYEFSDINDDRGTIIVPLHPATLRHPLTNPDRIQLAQYELGGYYKPHSDNSVDAQGIRRNFRRFTCILYCTEGWKAEYGGSLRIYTDSMHLLDPDDAIEEKKEYFDVTPKNGRLLVFDSRMVHSVEPITHPSKVRRALTLWITRPDNSPVVVSGDEE